MKGNYHYAVLLWFYDTNAYVTQCAFLYAADLINYTNKTFS